MTDTATPREFWAVVLDDVLRLFHSRAGAKAACDAVSGPAFGSTEAAELIRLREVIDQPTANPDTKDWHKLFLDAKTLLDARDEELRRLKEQLKLGEPYFKEWQATMAENERLRDLLQRHWSAIEATMHPNQWAKLCDETEQTLKAGTP